MSTHLRLTPGTRFTLEVQPVIPKSLERLHEIANDLLYSWDRNARALFYRLDRELWQSCGHNPKVFLRRIAQQRLEQAAQDSIYMGDYHRMLDVYDSYRKMHAHPSVAPFLDPQKDLVAYFCAEFGFHESVPLYSGGLGILAGDHCKAASDLSIPFVAVGILYRQGYFNQIIDGQGHQVARYVPTDFADLPVTPATNAAGEEIQVSVDLAGRSVILRVWAAQAGHIRLYLQDSDMSANSAADRSITYQLYGGDTHTRIQQEIVLGIGGVRALRALGLKPSVWHINEGHAAFQILERCRTHVAAGLDFDTALELVAAGTVFTTHTPVAAGHDIFDHHHMQHYFADFVPQLGIDMEMFLQLGSSPSAQGGFNQTALALRGSRFHNGVSAIHCEVASRMESYIWPQVPPDENPIAHVTNGVHVPTFLARDWVNVFDMRFGAEWRNELHNAAYWDRIDSIPDHSFWSLRQSLKADLLTDICRRLIRQYSRNGWSPTQIERVICKLTPHETDVLTLGFARRFATYKRAALLFTDPERLARLLNDPKRPLIIVFAGKAHPSDLPGQHLIQTIHDYARRPEFEGKVLLLEGYDLSLARKMVAGVDVWLNTPQYPLEASGTSGQKAAINGGINLSVLDGWWGEGYNGNNGWAITPYESHDGEQRNNEEADELLNILEHEVLPLYYDRDGHGYSSGWVKKSKESMKSIIPRFNAQRMVMDYVEDSYAPAVRQHARLAQEQAAGARTLARWKNKVASAWPKVSMRLIDKAPEAMQAGEQLQLRIGAHLHALTQDDVVVECLLGIEGETGVFIVKNRIILPSIGTDANGETLFKLPLIPSLPGLQCYKLRMYPYHSLLSRRFETGYMLWL